MPFPLPDCPAGWIVSTAQPTHLSLYDLDDGRSIVVRPAKPVASPADPAAIDRWTVKGLAGYGPRYPIFVAAVSRSAAITTAESVMTAIEAGETPSPVRLSDRSDAGSAATSTGETAAADSRATEQPSLIEFTDDSDTPR